MGDFIRSRMTLIVTAALIITCAVPLACASLRSHPPGNISQVEQITEIKNRGDCLPNQYFDVNNFTCENCTYCYRGAEHFPYGQCGNGYGVKTTCRRCREGFHQINEGYTNLVCRSCVTCDPKAEVLRRCTPTQNTVCGDCPPGTYPFTPNVCVTCTQDPTNPACARPAPTHTASTNQLAPAKPSSISLPNSTQLPPTTVLPLSVSSQAQNTSNDYGEPGTPTRKLSNVGIIIIVAVIVICVILLTCWRIKKWRAGSGSESENVLPSKQQLDTFLDNLTTANEHQSPLTTPDKEVEGNPEESVAFIRRGEPTTHATAPSESVQLLGAGVPVNQPAVLSSDVFNAEVSMPGTLSSNGGPGGDAMYQQNNVLRSSDSAGDSIVFAEDDAGSLSLPKPLLS